MDELVETTADDPGAMLHPSGKYMVQKMHLNARLNSKAKAPLPFVRDTDQKPVGSEDENVSFLEKYHVLFIRIIVCRKNLDLHCKNVRPMNLFVLSAMIWLMKQL